MFKIKLNLENGNWEFPHPTKLDNKLYNIQIIKKLMKITQTFVIMNQ